MKNLVIINLLFVLVLAMSVSCSKADVESQDKASELPQLATLPDIDISVSSDGVVNLPDNVPAMFTEIFTKYTRIYAPNGKPIHMLAQAGWTIDQIKKARNVLLFILTDYPGSKYGNDKSDVANAMADRKATMVLFNTAPDLEKAMRGPLGRGTDLSMQDLRANECPAEGDNDYMNHITRDASFEEIWHLVHDNGVKAMLPDMIAEMRKTNDIAKEKGWKAWPEDEPVEHPNEYVGVLIDNYYDLWTVRPQLYEGRDISPEDVPEGQSHFGRYFAGSRKRMEKTDPDGYDLIQKFFPPYLTYTPELPEDFTGTFSLSFDNSLAYTYKSQHLLNVILTGKNNSSLVGNAFGNVLTGNAGNNVLEGKAGNDRLDGGEGIDTAVFSGNSAEYTLTKKDGQITVADKQKERDGTASCRNIEVLKFKDKNVKL